MDTTFSAAQIVDKTLTAKRTVYVYRDATDVAKSYGKVDPGNPVGVVLSWLDPKAGRSKLWWVFRDGSGGYYYTPHDNGIFDVADLKAQGAITVTDQREKEEFDDLPWYEQLIKKYGIYLLAVPVAVAVVPPLISEIFKSRR